MEIRAGAHHAAGGWGFYIGATSMAGIFATAVAFTLLGAIVVGVL
jgi:hypothetical protein